MMERQILDQALIFNETIEVYRLRKKEGVILKLDFEKVYNHVDWVLIKKGFDYKWRMWMWGCVRNVKYSILINGTLKWLIQATKGLRPGDPLSSFLFLLVVDVLSQIIYKVVEGNIIDPFWIRRNEVSLSHCQFVNETMLFCSGKEEFFIILNHMVALFEDMSGLKINRSKCTIFGINTDQVKLQRWTKVFDYEIDSLPSSYLGLPSGRSLEL